METCKNRDKNESRQSTIKNLSWTWKYYSILNKYFQSLFKGFPSSTKGKQLSSICHLIHPSEPPFLPNLEVLPWAKINWQSKNVEQTYEKQLLGKEKFHSGVKSLLRDLTAFTPSNWQHSYVLLERHPVRVLALQISTREHLSGQSHLKKNSKPSQLSGVLLLMLLWLSGYCRLF